MAGKSPTLIEGAFFPRDMADVVALKRRLVEEAGESDAAAAGCAMWVLCRAQGEPDGTNSATRVRYRKMLEQLREPIAPPPPTGSDDPRVVPMDQGRRRPRRDEGGSTTAVASARALFVAVAMALAAHSGLSAAAGSSETPLRDASPARTPVRAPGGPLEGDAVPQPPRSAVRRKRRGYVRSAGGHAA